MKVLLIKDVKSLGKAGEIKEVKHGYGQNFLIKNGHAKLATDAVVAQWESEQEVRKEQEAAEIAALKEIEKKLAGITVKISKKVGANGALFGAITKEEIAEALQQQENIEIDKKGIEIDNPLKSTGIYDVALKLGHGIHAKLKIDVEGQDV